MAREGKPATRTREVIYLPWAESTAVAVKPGWATIGIFVLLLIGSVLIARDFLMPITMAVLLFFVFSPLVRRLGRRGVPAWLTASMVVAALVALMAAVVLSVMSPVGQLIRDAPTISSRLELKFDELKESVKPIREIADRIDRLTSGEAQDPGVIHTEPDQPGVAEGLASGAPWLMGQFVFVLVLMFFLLTSGDLLYLKIVQSVDTLARKRAAYQALRQIEESLGNYLGTISLINVGLGVAIGLAFWAMGMPAPFLFGVLACLFNFIPYIGAMMGAGLSVVVALVSMDGFFWPAMIGLAYVAINGVEGQFVTPYFLSRRLELNTVVVFIAVALWAWLWSIVGMIVAVPILVMIRVLCEHVSGLEKFANFLGGEDAPRHPDEEEAESAPAAPG